MPDENLRDLVDTLSPTTRSERRALLVSSVALAALSWGDLVPNKIDALGLEVTSIRGHALIWLACLITGYFLVAFVVYYRADRFAAGRAAIDTVDALTTRFIENGINEAAGMTKERFGQVMSAWWEIQLKRYVYPRYQFEVWSAITAGVTSILLAIAWLYRS